MSTRVPFTEGDLIDHSGTNDILTGVDNSYTSPTGDFEFNPEGVMGPLDA